MAENDIPVFVDPAPAEGKAKAPKARQVARIKPGEACVIVQQGYAGWRGRKKRAITLMIPVSALLAFVSQMRYKPRPEASALDSRTHKKLPGLANYMHIRNEHYAPDAAGRDEVYQPELVTIRRVVEQFS